MQMRGIKLHFGWTACIAGVGEYRRMAFPWRRFVSDLRQALPLDDATCRLIFTEHVFERIDEDFRLPALNEFLRALRPWGTLRIVVLDCEQFVDAYTRRDMVWFQTVLGVSAGRAEGLNRVFTMCTQRVIDDWESLSAVLQEVGFSDVERSSLNASTIPELRTDSEEPSRTLCSL